MGDFNGKNYKDEFVGELVNFVASDTFQTMFETFFLKYALEFGTEEEHKLRYYEIYQEFHDMFEAQLEKFCEKLQLTQAQFMRRCREATLDDPKANHYINILLSSVEYETFVKLMRIMKPVALKGKAEMKKETNSLADDEKPVSQQSSPSKMSKLDADFNDDEARMKKQHDEFEADAKHSSDSAAEKDGK
mmetsp:Transcript_7508/g.10360  ORF Transcript_7508/g.10360 Transcript_7508/m.10360 type:complete len:190 (+) Transcript_7508:59-628(+)